MTDPHLRDAECCYTCIHGVTSIDGLMSSCAAHGWNWMSGKSRKEWSWTTFCDQYEKSVRLDSEAPRKVEILTCALKTAATEVRGD